MTSTGRAVDGDLSSLPFDERARAREAKSGLNDRLDVVE
jgi:hypothetical protein